jgi:hypothetical protein
MGGWCAGGKRDDEAVKEWFSESHRPHGRHAKFEQINGEVGEVKAVSRKSHHRPAAACAAPVALVETALPSWLQAPSSWSV